MKLAEGLIRRADYQKRAEQLKHRLLNIARIQEGEKPFESPQELENELGEVLKELKDLMSRINRTNHQTAFDDELSLGDALIKREILAKERKVYSDLAEQAATRQDRYSRTEIKYVTPFNVKDLQKKVDDLAKQYREVDTKIQELNWLTDLSE
ncbi:DIP1984 family protein [Sutcliffiella halmapala]|uniref:DIP1984 family protein n=1 Tax=Sutcliffiella halmapala TaxID=79882 RepID=UPI0009957E00|nr:DIP1984 family protein [Sutcliffiella halmapala]